MREIEDAVFQALLRAQGYIDENDALLKGVDLVAARKRLDEVVETFRTHAIDQNVGDRGALGETAKQRELRVKLRKEQMEPVAVIARRNLRSVPEYAALQMPKPSVVGQAFLASASGMAKAATIHKDTLIAHGMSSTFLDDFNASIASLADSLIIRQKSVSQRVKATKALSVEEKNARTILSVLDALVRQAVGTDETLWHSWESARMIRRRPGARTGAPAPATTPTAAPSAVATPAAPTAVAPTPQPVGETTPPAAAA